MSATLASSGTDAIHVDTARLIAPPAATHEDEKQPQMNADTLYDSRDHGHSHSGSMSVTTSAFLNHYRQPVTLTLTPLTLTMTLQSSRATETHRVSDLIGCQRAQSGAALILHFYRAHTALCCPSLSHTNTDSDSDNDSDKKRIHYPLSLLTNDTDALSLWHVYFNRAAQSLPLTNELLPQRKILVFVNPHSGTGLAEPISVIVQEILVQSGIPHMFVSTGHPGHCEIMVAQHAFHSDQCATSVVTISGDGLMYEVINGIMGRSDWATILPSLTIGVIAGGSGNGLAKSVCSVSGEHYDIVNQCFLILKNYRRPLDLTTVTRTDAPADTNNGSFCYSSNRRTLFSFLSLSWAMISDIDLDSEKYRWMGSARFTAAAVANILKHHSHQAELAILTDPQTDTNIDRHGPIDRCGYHTACQSCLSTSQSNEIHQLKHYLASQSQPQPATDGDSVSVSVGGSDSESDRRYQWKSLSLSQIRVLWAMNVQFAATDVHCAPRAHLSDGMLDLLLIRRSTRLSLLTAFLNLETGQHLFNDGVEYYRVKGLRIVPHSACPFSIDGERLDSQPIEMRIWRGILNIHCK